jgi:hypothetical protein
MKEIIQYLVEKVSEQQSYNLMMMFFLEENDLLEKYTAWTNLKNKSFQENLAKNEATKIFKSIKEG